MSQDHPFPQKDSSDIKAVEEGLPLREGVVFFRCFSSSCAFCQQLLQVCTLVCYVFCHFLCNILTLFSNKKATKEGIFHIP